jgi:hypothetical protein
MTVTAVCANLAVLLPLLAPGSVASADPPNSVSAGAAPTWVILPGPEQEEDYGDSNWEGLRTYHLLFLAGTLGSGAPGDLSIKCKVVLDNWRGFFLARPMLGNLPTGLANVPDVEWVRPTDDSGLAGIDWAGVTHVGVTCHLLIKELRRFTYLAGQ